jgi:hypothetical protein
MTEIAVGRKEKPMTLPILDPDFTRRDDGPYWAAALVAAIRAKDADRIALARQNLQRLGYRIDILDARRSEQGAQHE